MFALMQELGLWQLLGLEPEHTPVPELDLPIGVVHAIRRNWADGSHDFVGPRSTRRQADAEIDRQHCKWRRSPWRPGLSIVTISVRDLRLHGRHRSGCKSPDCPVSGQAVCA